RPTLGRPPGTESEGFSVKEKGSFNLKKFLNEFEIYFGAIIFIAMTVLLFIQVVTRYLLHRSFTWTEEIATIFFVWMVYLGVCSAVLRRKHLRIDAFVEAMPFKVKKVLLIISNIIFIAFLIYLIFPLMKMVQNYASRGAATPLLKFPNAVAYGMLPLTFALTCIRLVQEIIRLAKEKEEDLGVSKPTIDMAALESEAAALQAQKAKKVEGGN
uniref:TRAP transporter small permease n=1 Tax=Vermiculatibacterium agrestimuris TaxID=2941519 RepID=UPI0020426096